MLLRPKRKSKVKQEQILDGEAAETRIYPHNKRVKKSPKLEASGSVSDCKVPPPKRKPRKKVVKKTFEPEWSNWVPTDEARFDGDPIPADEARSNWPKRYSQKDSKNKSVKKDDKSEVRQAKNHYSKAIIDKVTYELNDDAYIKAEENKKDYIAKIVEMFEADDGRPYISALWFYRGDDTIMKGDAKLVKDDKRVFMSKIPDDNPLDAIVSKVRILKIHPNVTEEVRKVKMAEYDMYYDMMYVMPCGFSNIDEDEVKEDSEESTVTFSPNGGNFTDSSMTLLDLYSGCGAMSTGLSLGAKLVNRWAVDSNKYACESLKNNHPGCNLWNDKAEDFFELLKKWQHLCKKYNLIGSKQDDDSLFDIEKANNDEKDTDLIVVSSRVEKLIGIRYGKPDKKFQKKKRKPDKGKPTNLYFKVKWKKFGSEDSWEPVSLLSDCEDKIKEFVTNGYKSGLVPIPGDVDVISGGPPCQGMSGHNRCRDKENPLDGDKNSQLKVYMDIIEFLKPKFILMENVVDMTKFSEGQLMLCAFARLISNRFQARLGIMAAGSYGVSQCRYRVFLWGALVTELLPHFPLPTHKLVGRGVVTNEFKDMIVLHEENSSFELNDSITLGDAISNMPEINNFEVRDEMPYTKKPLTEFQKHIRLQSRSDIFGDSSGSSSQKAMLYDHIPLKLNNDNDDYARVCRIPKKKGACFRDLNGVKVDENNVVYFDSKEEREKLPSGNFLVPNYAMTYVKGKSLKPFGRLSMDETVGTAVTKAEPHNQIIIHPDSDRVLSVISFMDR